MTTAAPPASVAVVDALADVPFDIAAVAYRSRETLAAYRVAQAEQAAAGIACAFCRHHDGAGAHLPVVSRHESMLVVRNEFPYAAWESRTVVDHLMVVPVRHLLRLADLTEGEAYDYLDATRTFEADGYSVYMRSQANPTRSVGHLHTHLILTGTAPV